MSGVGEGRTGVHSKSKHNFRIYFKVQPGMLAGSCTSFYNFQVFLFFLCVRPQERRTGYEQFHPGPSPVDHDSLESKRPRLEQVSDPHFQRVSAAVLPVVHTLPEGLRSSADAKKVNICSLPLWSCRSVMLI